MDASTTGLEPGTLVGEYVVVESLRIDGDVVVHRARQTSVDRTVELHVLDAESRSYAFMARARHRGHRPSARTRRLASLRLG